MKCFAVLVGLIGFGLGMGSGHFAWANICAGHCIVDGHGYVQKPDESILCYCDGICHQQDPSDCCQDDAGTKGGDRTYVDAACGAPPPPPPSAYSPVGGPCDGVTTGCLGFGGAAGGGVCYQGGAYPDGYCTIYGCATATVCHPDTPNYPDCSGLYCPAGSVCLYTKSGPAQGYNDCFASCTTDADCRSGYKCYNGLGCFSAQEPAEFEPAKNYWEGLVEGAVCGNGVCEAGEDGANCEADCGGGSAVCGNGTCEAGEDGANCEADCGDGSALCDNGTCESGESFENCPADCPSPDQPKSPIGGACSQHPDCITHALCVTVGAPGGYCTIVDCEADACPEGGGCFSLTQPDSEDEPGRLCLATCQKDEDCRTGEGYACKTGACLPKEGVWTTLELVRLDKEITDDKKKQGDGGGSGGCSLLR